MDLNNKPKVISLFSGAGDWILVLNRLDLEQYTHQIFGS